MNTILDHHYFQPLADPKNAPSEMAKYRHLIGKYCFRPDGLPGCVLDIATQGEPICPWAIGLDLPVDEFNYYCGNHPAKGPIQCRGHADKLPFDDNSFDTLSACHYAEDVPQSKWPELFGEWKRVLKPGGYMIVLVPEVERWNYAIKVLGQCPNCSHSAPEPSVGDMSRVALQLGMEVIEDRLTDCYEHDYSILGVFKKP